MTGRAADVLVVGAGVIGLSAAWRVAQDGQRVTVVDPDPRRAATRVAAGMLAPVTEAHYTEPELLGLMLRSAQRWPGFAAELAGASGLGTGYVDCGTLAVAFDADDRAELDRLHGFMQAHGLDALRLTATECRTEEPALAPGVRGGLLVPGDHQVDPRRLMAALQAATDRTGVVTVSTPVVGLLEDARGVSGVRLGDGGVLRAGTVVVAAGAWSPLLGVSVPVRPVRGEILRLQGPAGLLRRPVRALVRGVQVYVVPRPDGEVVVGATSEERGYDVSVTADGVYTLLRDARAVLPAIAELAVSEVSAGLRPVSPDNAPIVGPAGPPGLVVATGHGRHGVLLAPVTADAVAALLRGEVHPLEGFGPGRFAAARA